MDHIPFVARPTTPVSSLVSSVYKTEILKRKSTSVVFTCLFSLRAHNLSLLAIPFNSSFAPDPDNPSPLPSASCVTGPFRIHSSSENSFLDFLRSPELFDCSLSSWYVRLPGGHVSGVPPSRGPCHIFFVGPSVRSDRLGRGSRYVY